MKEQCAYALEVTDSHGNTVAQHLHVKQQQAIWLIGRRGPLTTGFLERVG